MRLICYNILYIFKLIVFYIFYAINIIIFFFVFKFIIINKKIYRYLMENFLNLYLYNYYFYKIRKKLIL